METELIIRIVLDILILLSGLLLILSKSYIKEKGKNVATKEDIGAITKEIESVKNAISFNNQRNMDWYVEIKNNMINCYDSYYKWINSFQIADILLTYHDNLPNLRETINELKNNNREFQKYFRRLGIYDEDLEFAKSISKIYSETIKRHNQVQRLLISLEEIAFHHENLINEADVKTDNTEIIRTELEELKKSKTCAFEEYRENYNELVDMMKTIQVEFAKHFRRKFKEDFGYVNIENE